MTLILAVSRVLIKQYSEYLYLGTTNYITLFHLCSIPRNLKVYRLHRSSQLFSVFIIEKLVLVLSSFAPVLAITPLVTIPVSYHNWDLHLPHSLPLGFNRHSLYPLDVPASTRVGGRRCV